MQLSRQKESLSSVREFEKLAFSLITSSYSHNNRYNDNNNHHHRHHFLRLIGFAVRASCKHIKGLKSCHEQLYAKKVQLRVERE